MSKQTSTQPGPAIETLHHRLLEIPDTLLNGLVGELFFALIHDTVYKKFSSFSHSLLEPFRSPVQQVNWYPLAAMIAYFVNDPAFDNCPLTIDNLVAVLQHTARELRVAGACDIYKNDVDRREEFIRVVLQRLALRPEGETKNQAEHRLQAVSSAERLKVLQASRAAEKRARAIREKLEEKRAREAADKMMRE